LRRGIEPRCGRRLNVCHGDLVQMGDPVQFQGASKGAIGAAEVKDLEWPAVNGTSECLKLIDDREMPAHPLEGAKRRQLEQPDSPGVPSRHDRSDGSTDPAIGSVV